jgi:hypothetical protein
MAATKTEWRLAGSLVTLRAQINSRWPRRDRSSDGSIGDEAHAARQSDHNPNRRGVVCAIDITHDPVNGPSGGWLAEALRGARDPRIAYVIWNRQIFSSSIKPWQWRPYTGSNPHTKHVHISVRDDVSDDIHWELA